MQRLPVLAASGERPPAQPYGVSPAGAEQWVRDAARWLGAADAEITRASNDGGVDVLTRRLAISVKHYAGTVPVEEVREIFAVAATMGREAMLWTSGTVTAAGAQFAEIAPVDLVYYDVTTGDVRAGNQSAERKLQEGLG